MSRLQFIKQAQINWAQWDACVAASGTNLPYAYSWYVNAVAENCDGLVWGNYEAVMPLMWLRKWGVKCLYQPYYCQQAGVFGKAVTLEMAEQFLSYAQSNYAYVNLNLNPAVALLQERFKLISRTNLLLPLSPPANQLQQGYSESHRRNIARAAKKGYLYSPQANAGQFIRFYLDNVNRAQQNFKPQHEEILKRLVQAVSQRQAGQVCSLQAPTGQWVSACLLLNSGNRLINIINVTSAEGKSSGAAHLLFHHIIQTHAPGSYVLDFEGSAIPGIARFYQGFGATPETYYRFYTTLPGRIKQRWG